MFATVTRSFRPYFLPALTGVLDRETGADFLVPLAGDAASLPGPLA